MHSAHSQLDHQFEDLGQQRESATLGMWLFLAQEVMFFGGLFAAYAVCRSLFYQGFQAGSSHLDVKLGAINTAFLIGSSRDRIAHPHHFFSAARVQWRDR